VSRPSIALPRSASGLDPLAVARRCAEEGGRIALESFRRPQEVSVKGRGNLVTASDLASERRIREILSQEYPEHSILSEETSNFEPQASSLETRGWMWVVDPLDGTRNYVSGIPFFCISIALCHDGEPLVGLTYDPNHCEAFCAEKGRGAWLERPGGEPEPVRSSTKPSVQASVLGIDLGYQDQRAKRMLALAHELFPGMQSVRIPGSAALGLAYAACGRYDLFVHNYLLPWDIAAGIALVREAGGLVTDRDGGPVGIGSEGVVAGGADVHADFLRLTMGIPWREEAVPK
jgi:myo-inositol-1(or 4)-monophosphatase